MTARPDAGARAKAPKNRAEKITAARNAAFKILLAVEKGDAHSDDLLRGKAVDALSEPDRNLATALELGVLRWQIQLDHQIQSLLTRPNGKLEPETRVALRLGAFQILHMDRIPARAAIDESVELAKQSGHRFASGMVNAVLRKLASAPRAEFVENSVTELALAEAHPAWMVERWARFYGLDGARAICRHGQMQPELAIRFAKPSVGAELTQAGVATQPGRLLTAARIVDSGDVFATSAFREGDIRPQDEGSQLVAEIAAANLSADAGRILDACAAPGGKTLILAERCSQARIVALESSSARLGQLQERLTAFADRVECRLADATQLQERCGF